MFLNTMYQCFFSTDPSTTSTPQSTDAIPRLPAHHAQLPAAPSAYGRQVAAHQQMAGAAQGQLAQWQLAQQQQQHQLVLQHQQQLVQQQQQQLLAQQQQQLVLHQALLMQQSASAAATAGAFYDPATLYYRQQQMIVEGTPQCQQIPAELVEQYQQQMAEAMGYHQAGPHMKTTVSADAISLMYQHAMTASGTPFSVADWPSQASGYDVLVRRASDGQIHIMPVTEASDPFHVPCSSVGTAVSNLAETVATETITSTEPPADIAPIAEVVAAGVSDDNFKVPNPPQPTVVCR